jgi:hypothetical protein
MLADLGGAVTFHPCRHDPQVSNAYTWRYYYYRGCLLAHNFLQCVAIRTHLHIARIAVSFCDACEHCLRYVAQQANFVDGSSLLVSAL